MRPYLQPSLVPWKGSRVHRRSNLTAADITTHQGIPVTSPVCTLVDLAATLPTNGLEAAINEADKRDVTSPESLPDAVLALPRRPGVAKLRKLLDRHTFRLTDSELERYFLPIARRVRAPAAAHPAMGERIPSRLSHQ